MKKIKVLILLFTVSFMIIACRSGSSLDQFKLQQYNGGNKAEQYNEDYDILDKGPVPGGVINLFSTEPDTLNPILTKNTYSSLFLGFIYEGLTRLDEKQQAVGQLSDEWTVSSNGLIWNFRMRSGVIWQDGQPFTANDVEFTIKSLLNPSIDSVYKPLLLNIESCATVDPSNIRIVLRKPNSFLPEMMTFPIIPKHQFKKMDMLSASKKFQPIGTGPYEFVSQNEKKKVELKINTNWWYLNTEGNKAQDGMYIEKVNMIIFNNPDDAMGAFQTGEIDAVGIKASDFVKYKGRTDLIIKKYTSRDFEFLAFNLKNPVIADNYVRRAIAQAINKEELINSILLGEAEASELPVLPDSWISESGGISEETDALSSGQILAEGGWKESKQGYYKTLEGVRKYLKVEIIVNSNNIFRIRSAKQICSQLEKVGIPAVLTLIDWKELMNRVSTAKYDIAFTGCRIPQIPDISYLYSNSYLPVSLPARYGGASNISGYFDMQVDAYITEMFRETDPGRKKMLYKSTKQLIINDTPYLGLYFLRNAVVYSKNIRGPLNPNTWNPYDGIMHWYKPELP